MPLVTTRWQLGVVEVARLRQVDERDGAGGLVVEQVEHDLALVGVDRGLITVRVIRRTARAGGSPSSQAGWPTCNCSDVRLGHGGGGGGRAGRGAQRLARRRRPASGLPAGEEYRRRGPTRPADAPLSPISQRRRTCRCRTTAAPADGDAVPLPACAGVRSSRRRSRPPWPVATVGYRWYSRGGRPTNPMHTSDRDTRTCSGLAAGIPADVRDRPRIVPARCRAGTLRYRFAAMRVPR